MVERYKGYMMGGCIEAKERKYVHVYYILYEYYKMDAENECAFAWTGVMLGMSTKAYGKANMA